MVADQAGVPVLVDTPPVPVAVGVPVGSAALGPVAALVVLAALVAPAVLAAVPVAGRDRVGSAVPHADRSVVVVATRTSCSHSI